ncbi:hypothetical protein OGAPHI_003551 [Ogataea philodendri]|uniref:Uncharacterized protein n=1 Tax=Ogataea philodendri TaxID=1378263 RepID=A0A9P8P7Q4_9ASCO|nr:uncharacterized protein OGAPHI_003551 [Ogataea philodendri]KAH3666372.1 hypothetical protein OGAPHI_003551 [Ogataea philodendri]
MAFIEAPAPLESTPMDLKTASLADQVPANDARGDGAERQYFISLSVKFLWMNVSLSMLMHERSSTSTPTPLPPVNPFAISAIILEVSEVVSEPLSEA